MLAGCAGLLAGLLAAWLGPPKSLFVLKRIRKFPGNFLMGSGSDTHVRIRQFLGNFLMGTPWEHTFESVSSQIIEMQLKEVAY